MNQESCYEGSKFIQLRVEMYAMTTDYGYLFNYPASNFICIKAATLFPHNPLCYSFIKQLPAEQPNIDTKLLNYSRISSEEQHQ